MTDYTQTQFDVALANLKNAICEDYTRFSAGFTDPELWYPADIIEGSGKKYLKLTTPNNSAWGFIVVDKNHKKFKYGDILKAASYKAPAMNSARGNIFTGYSGVQWTGPTYCGTPAQTENEARAEMQKQLNELATV